MNYADEALREQAKPGHLFRSMIETFLMVQRITGEDKSKEIKEFQTKLKIRGIEGYEENNNNG